MRHELSHVNEILKGKSIILDEGSLKIHHSQGLTSEVYSASSSHGPLIVHIAKTWPVFQHVNTPDKLLPVSEFLRDTEIPAARILSCTKYDGYFVTVQECMPGEEAGHIEKTTAGFRPVWQKSFKEYEHAMQEMFVRLHAIPVEGFGWPGTNMRGSHASWLSHWESEVAFWRKYIERSEAELGEEKARIAERLENMFEKIAPVIDYGGAPSLVHGDAMNPSNTLVADGKITGLVDWEMAIYGDPAWEFAYMNLYSLETYFSLRPELRDSAAQKQFRERMECYHWIIVAFWMFLHTRHPENELYDIVRRELLKNFDEMGL